MIKQNKGIFYLLLLIAFSITGCKKENNTKPKITKSIATQILLVSGNNLSGDEKTALAQPCVIQVLDAEGNPASGVQVTFKVIEGGGSVSASVVLSDQDGFAETVWTLGSQSQPVQKMEASAENEGKEMINGSPIEFTASVYGYFTDTRDGQKYRIVTIGDQTWFAENLNYKTSNSYCYDKKDSNCDIYGRLYLWSSVQTACPNGWHLPSDQEWMQLEMTLGLPEDKAKEYGGFRDKLNIGGKLKSTSGWTYSEYAAATNESGFSAFPGGFRNSSGQYYDIGESGVFWTSTPYLVYGGGNMLIRKLNYMTGDISKYSFLVENGASCRCVQD